VPWLITTLAWPALMAHMAGATARVVVAPAVVAGALACAVVGACAGALTLRSRAIARRRSSSG
jgi:hypothetical protein